AQLSVYRKSGSWFGHSQLTHAQTIRARNSKRRSLGSLSMHRQLRARDQGVKHRATFVSAKHSCPVLCQEIADISSDLRDVAFLFENACDELLRRQMCDVDLGPRIVAIKIAVVR